MSTLKLKGSTSGYVELTAPAIAGNNTITLSTNTGTLVLKDPSNNFEVGTGVTIGAGTSNTFTLSTNGSERIRVDSLGDVGIGTTNPQYTLDVVGDINLTGTFRQNGSQFVASRWTSGTGDDIYRLSGDVGIGTTNPQYSLDVVGDINFTGTFRQNGSQFVASRWTSGIGDDIYRLSGDVGIGTTNPGQALDVSGSIRASSQLISSVSTGTAPFSVSSTTLVTNLNADLLDGLNSTSANTGSTIVARDSSGNFSAGTISATAHTVSGNLAAWNTTTQGTGLGGIHLGAASGTSNVGPAITFGARDASSGGNAQAGIYINSDGTYGTKMYFATTDSYAQGSKTAMSIDHTGAVTITRSNLLVSGNSSTLYGPNSTWGAYLRVGGNGNGNDSITGSVAVTNGNIHIDARNGGYGVYLNWYSTSTGGTYFGNGASGQVARIDASGNITASGNVTAYSSDQRLKENLQHIQSPLEKVQKLNGYTFDWNEKSKELGFTPKHQTNDIGLLAQEVEKVLPQAVAPAPFDRDTNEFGENISKSGEDYLTIQYERLVPLLVEAIKEQQEQINTLKEEINNLKK